MNNSQSSASQSKCDLDDNFTSQGKPINPNQSNEFKKIKFVCFVSKGSITNGAAWYSVNGGMQDFNYLASNDYEITVELGCDKFPEAEQLENEWMNNQEALIAFLWQSHLGIKGLIRDAITGAPIENAEIKVANATEDGKGTYIAHDAISNKNGEYWRLLTPGLYHVMVDHDQYQSSSRWHEVTHSIDWQRIKKLKSFDRFPQAERVDFELQPISGPNDESITSDQVLDEFIPVESMF
jgi:carboxypeptidase E